MKPNPETSRYVDHRGEERFSSRFGPKHPLINYPYHAFLGERQVERAISNQKKARPIFAAGFRNLSDKFFNTEEKQHYVFEALLFAIIVAISAWPIASMIQALADFLK